MHVCQVLYVSVTSGAISTTALLSATEQVGETVGSPVPHDGAGMSQDCGDGQK